MKWTSQPMYHWRMSKCYSDYFQGYDTKYLEGESTAVFTVVEHNVYRKVPSPHITNSTLSGKCKHQFLLHNRAQ